MSTISKSSVTFLRNLSKNNNRDWFNTNKEKYKAAHEEMKAFLSSLETELNKFDVIEKAKLMRIYRDIRFSKDKTPYKQHFGMSLSRSGNFRRGGYFFRVQPKESFMAAGFWAPESKDLKLIRDHIAADPKPLRKIINAKKFKDYFGTLEGEKLKNVPRGFDKEHPAGDLLKFKQFIVTHKFPTSQVTEPGFIKELIKCYKAVGPWFAYMSDILTHDLNGVPLYTD